MRRLVLLCVVAAAALVAWWLLRDEVPTADGDRASAPAPAAAPPPPAKSPERGSRRAVVEEAPAAVPAPAPARAVEKIAEAGSGDTLLVVDDATGQSLAGVSVAFLPVPDDTVSWPADIRAAFVKNRDPIDTIMEHGRAFVSDEHGKVVLPKFEGTAIVAARHGESWGSSLFGAGLADQRLELHRAVPLAAIVVDADGRPCGGVKVLVLRHGESGYPVCDATTDAKDGAARFAEAFAQVPATDADLCAVTVALPLARTPSVVVDPRKPPADPVRLVLPPGGRVRCDVVDEQGGTAAAAPVVVLRRAAGDAKGAADVAGYEFAEANLDGGAARFPYVGLGLQLEVEVASADRSRVTVKQQFAGPTAAGEETVVRVTVGGRRPAVVGRLVDGKGVPVTGVDLLGAIVEPGRPLPGSRSRSTTDADGRFRFAFDRAAGDASSAKLEIGRAVRDGVLVLETRFALLDLPSVLPSGDVDIGDVVFRGAGLLGAGVVIDAEGKPLAGVTIAAMTTGGGAERSPIRDADAVASDSEGHFRLEGDPSGGRVLLGAILDGYFAADELAFAAGAADVRVVLQKAGGIAGSVRVPDGMPLWRVRVLVQGAPANNGDTGYRFRGEGLSIPIDADGKFEVRTLRPGRARVSIRFGWNRDDTILAVDGVEVVAGEVTRDPRLQDVDAAKSLHALRVVVHDKDGKPVEGAEVHFRPVGADGYWTVARRTDADGAATVQAKAGDASGRGIDFVVTCRGYRSGVVRAAKADATIVLERAKASIVTVRLASGSPLPDPPFQLGASLQWIRPGAADDEQRWHDPRDIRPSAAKFGKDRVLTFETFDAGRYRVELTLWELEMSGGSGSGVATVPKAVVVTIGADGTPAEVFVGVDAEELRRRTSEER